MADSFPTLNDLIRINDKNARDNGITDLLNDAPFLRVLAATTASNGTQHKYLKEVGAPSVGFRAVNSGRYENGSDDELVTVDLKILDASLTRDIALAKGYSKGVDAFLARESGRSLRAALFAFEQQVFGGQDEADTTGFVGLADALDGLSDEMVVNATGSTANSATSVYLVRTNGDELDMMAVVGNDGQISIEDTSIVRVEELVDTGNRGGYSAYHIPILGWVGVQVGGARSVARICNLTTQSTKGLTDILIAEAISRFPAARKPNYIAMNRQSLGQLQKSRTATNATGAPAPFPTESHGVPIVVTDAISNTEAIVA